MKGIVRFSEAEIVGGNHQITMRREESNAATAGADFGRQPSSVRLCSMGFGENRKRPGAVLGDEHSRGQNRRLAFDADASVRELYDAHVASSRSGSRTFLVVAVDG